MPSCKKPCPDGKICNQKSGKCVNRSGKIGKTISSRSPTPKRKSPSPLSDRSSRKCKKPCSPSKVCNPKTGRCVKRSGKIGKTMKSRSPSPKRKSPSPKRKSPSPKRKSPSPERKSPSPKRKSPVKGKVYIASMNMRGTWAPRPSGTVVLNVTSMQRKDSIERRDFSPMSKVEGGYKGFWCFENYWQSGRVLEGFDDEKFKNWWKNLKQGKRRYPGSKGVKVLYSEFNGKRRNYIESRKEIYVPEYYEMVKNRESMKKWKKLVDEGTNVVVYDFDGPRVNGEPTYHEVTVEYLKEKINYEKDPFGHGFVVAGALLGIKPEQYV